MSILQHRHAWLCWLARLAGGTGLAYCASTILGDTLDGTATEDGRMRLVLLIFAALAYLAAWWRETEGGTALATIAVALGGVAFTFAERQPFAASLVTGLPLFFAGGLFVLAGRYDLGADTLVSES